MIPSSDIHDIEQLRERLIVAERDLAGKVLLIDKLEQVIAQLAQRHWGRSSEKHPGQAELSLFNEAELAAMQASLEDELDDTDEPVNDSPTDAEDAGDTGASDPATPAKPAKPRPRRQLPDHLERVRVTHELDEEHRQAACGSQLIPIGEEVTEQIGVLPARQFVIQHVKINYACACKECGVKTASMPL